MLSLLNPWRKKEPETLPVRYSTAEDVDYWRNKVALCRPGPSREAYQRVLVSHLESYAEGLRLQIPTAVVVAQGTTTPPDVRTARQARIDELVARGRNEQLASQIQQSTV